MKSVKKNSHVNELAMISPERIGANLRRLRLEHGETQQQLGEFLGYGATTIANYESGYRLPDLETFFRIAIRYDADLQDFLVHES